MSLLPFFKSESLTSQEMAKWRVGWWPVSPGILISVSPESLTIKPAGMFSRGFWESNSAPVLVKQALYQLNHLPSPVNCILNSVFWLFIPRVKKHNWGSNQMAQLGALDTKHGEFDPVTHTLRNDCWGMSSRLHTHTVVVGKHTHTHTHTCAHTH